MATITTAADLLIRVLADTAGAAAAFSGLQGNVEGVSSALNAASNSGATFAQNLDAAQPAAQAFALAGGLIVGALGLATKTAADFEAQISVVKSVMDPAQVVQYGDKIRDLALALGADTGLTVSASQAAAGIEELVKAGMPLETILNGGARAAIALANATGITVADAASIAASAMNAFKIPATDVASTMDWLAGVSNATAADMGDLRYGLASVGAVASIVGLSFQDTALALGIFSNAGLRGMDSGTSLKTMLINLTPSTDKAAAQMQALGIITADGTNLFFDQAGRVKDLGDISAVLSTHLAGLTDQQRLAALQVMFGTDAVRAAAILARTSTADFDALATSIGGMTAADMAAQRLQNFNGVMENLKGILETAAITVGDRFLPALTGLATEAGKVLSAFLTLPKPVQDLIVGVTAAAGAFLTLTGGAVLLGPKIIAVVEALGPMAASLGAILAPLAAVAAAAFVLYEAWTNNWFGIRDTVSAAVEPILTWFGHLSLAIQDLIKNGDITRFMESFSAITGIDFMPVVKMVQELSMAIGHLLEGDVDTFIAQMQIFTGIDLTPLVTLVQGLGRALGELAISFADLFAGNIDVATFFQRVGTAITGGAATVTGFFSTLFSSINWAAVWASVTTIGSSLLASGISIASSVQTWLNGIWASIDWNATWAWAGSVWQGFLSTAGNMGQGVLDWLKGLWGLIDWNATWAAAGTLWQSFLTTIGSIGTGVLDWLKGVWAGINWGSVWAEAKTIGTSLLTAGLSMGTSVLDWLKGVWAGINWAEVWKAASGMATNLSQGALAMGTEVLNWLKGIWGGIKWADVWKEVTTLGSTFAASGLSIIAEATTWVKAQFTGVDWPGVWTAIQTNIGAAFRAVQGLGLDLWAFLFGRVEQIDASGTTRITSGFATKLYDDIKAGVAAINWTEIWSQVKVTADQLGVSGVATAIDGITTSVKAIGDYIATPEGKSIAAFFGTLATIAAGYAAITALAGAITTLSIALGALAILATPLALDAIAISAIVAAGVWAYNTFPGFAKATDAAALSLKNFGDYITGGQLVKDIESLGQSIFSVTWTISKAIGDFILGTWTQIDASGTMVRQGGLAHMFDGLVDWGKDAGRTFEGIWNTISGFITRIGDAVKTVLYGPIQFDPTYGLDRTGGLIAAWDSLREILDKIGLLKPFGWLEGLAALLPDWLKPGSPTPWEIALGGYDGQGGLIGVLRTLASLNPFGWLLDLISKGIDLTKPLFGGSSSPGGVGGGTGSGNTYNITVNAASGSAQDIVQAIVDAFETLAGEEPLAEAGVGGGGAW